jgi:lysophospholipase L1-like esterase
MYGGSTTWGVSQRDDHTIASELARVAVERGITLDVQNRGLPGFHHWLEAERLAWDLTTNPRPDLVIFYDGVNDRFWQPGLSDPIFDALWDQSGRTEGDPPQGPAGSRVAGPPEPRFGGLLQTEEGVRRYDQAREMSRATAAAAGVPVRYVWQPERYSRDFVASEPHFDTGHENDARRGSQFAWERLADDVIDLHDALTGNTDPIYTDDVHHNELGARLIAEALFERLRPDLEGRAS